MNWFDLMLVAVLLISIADGIAKGFGRAVVSFVAFVIAVGAALWFYAPLGFWLRGFITSKPAANLTAFFLVFAVIGTLGGLAEREVGRFIRKNELTGADRGLGAGFGVFNGVFGASILVLIFLSFYPYPVLKSTLAGRYLPVVTEVAQAVSQVAPEEVREGYQRARRDLDRVAPPQVGRSLDQLTAH